MMEKLFTTLLPEIVALVKNYGLEAIIWILLVVCFLGGTMDYLPKEYFNTNNGLIITLLYYIVKSANTKKKIVISKQDETEEMKIRMQANNDVNLNLLKLKYEVDAERAFVMEFHNGRISLNGIPFLYLDMSYEKCTDGHTYVSDDYQNLNTSLYAFPSYMVEKCYFAGTMEELEEIDPKIAHRMLDNGVGYCAAILLKKNGNLIGILGVSYKEHELPMSREEVHTKLSIYAQDITDSLDAESFKRKQLSTTK
jgi:hypothetical protein